MFVYRFARKKTDPESVPEWHPGYPGERSDPDSIYRPDKYSNDFIWDGETVDEEKP